MKVSEIKSATNDELILWIARQMGVYNTTKGGLKTAERICKELEQRGVVSNEFFDKWYDIYSL